MISKLNSYNNPNLQSAQSSFNSAQNIVRSNEELLVQENPTPSASLSNYQPENVQDYIKDIELINQMINKKIQFDMEYDNNEIVVRIIDRETEEVLREYPPEELRDLHQQLKETAEMLGLIVDTKA